MAIGKVLRGLAALGGLLAAAACGVSGPRPLALGADQCAHCHMTLADSRFAAELVTRTGKSIPFDDVGCLAAYVVTGGPQGARIGSLWVNDYARPDTMLEVTRAVFLRSDSFHTPMDYHLVALRPGRAADSLRAAVGGELLTWDQVLELVGRGPEH
jgi:copper chaperone NosL